MYRKLGLALIALMILFNSIAIQGARAAPTPDEAKWVVSSKITGYHNALENNYKGQYGLYYNLYYLALATRWTDYMWDFGGKNGLEFSEYEKTEYHQRLIQSYKVFNRKFGKTPQKGTTFYFEGLTLTAKSGTKDFKAVVLDSINTKIPAYLEKQLEAINTDIKAAGSEDEKTAIYEKQKDSLRYIYKILDVLLNEKQEIELIAPQGSTPFTTGSPNSKPVMENKDFIVLLEKGREMDSSEVVAIDNTEMPNSAEYVERLAHVLKKSASEASEGDLGASVWKIKDGESGPDGSYQLRDEYIRMFSASAVYRPLVSHVGDAEFIEAMGSLFVKDQVEQALQLYDEIKDYRKPLYVMYDASKWYEAFGFRNKGDGVSSIKTFTAEASPIKLTQFAKIVEDEELSALVMMKGKLQTSATDSNSYFYFSDNPKFTGDTVTSTVTPAAPEPEAVPETPTTTDPADTADPTNPIDPAVPEEETPVTEDVVSTDDYKKGNNIIAAASDKMTSKNWTYAVLESGGESKDNLTHDTAVLTMATLKNVFKNHNYMKDLSNKDDSFLFMNAFGDIVTQDNLVVVPGAVNPLFYQEGKGYNPYTVAFMSGYPALNGQAGKMVLGNEADKGKYTLISGENEPNKTSTFVRIKGENNLASTEPFMTTWVNLKLAEPILGMDNPFERSDLSAKLTGTWNSLKTSFGGTTTDPYKDGLIVVKQDAVIDGTNIMSYDPASDGEYRVAKYIARNAYYSFRTVDGQVSESFNEVLRQDFIFKNVVVEALNGTVYTTAYLKELTETLGNIQEQGYGFMKRIIHGLAQEVLESTGHVDGILGVKDSRQDPIFGWMFQYTDRFFWLIIVVLSMIFLVRYMRNGTTLLYSIISIAVALSVVFLFIKVIPVYMPTVYNIVLNNTNRDLSYNILATKAEKYTETYKNSGIVGEDGKFKMNTASINLYKFDGKSLNQVLDQYKIKPEDISGGNIFVLDENTGLFLEGSSLKLNIDTLLYSNPVTGDYKETEYGSLYQLQADKVYSSVLDYYTPFYQVEQGFVDTLNKLLQMYKIPRHSAQYGGGLTKDSFLVYNYMNSMPFLTPGEYKVDEEDLTMGEEVDKLKALFDNPDTFSNSNDILGLNSLLKNPTPQMQETLWWRTMVQNGLIVDENIATEDDILRYNRFLESVNYLTKKFMIDLKPQVGLMSDENLVKIISLYATTIFNQKISEYNNMAYPHYINYQDFRLADVYLSAFTTDYNRFSMSDKNVATYVANNTDALALLVMSGNIILGALITQTIKFLLPVLFLSFGFILFGRFIGNFKLKSVVSGYMKVSGLIFGCLTIFVASFGWIQGWNLTISIWVMFLLYLLIVTALVMIITSVLFNFTEMGNSKIDATFSKIADKLHMSDTMDKLKVMTTRITNKQTTGVVVEQDSRFGLDSGLTQHLDKDVIDLTYLQKEKLIKPKGNNGTKYYFDEDEEIKEEVKQKRN